MTDIVLPEKVLEELKNPDFSDILEYGKEVGVEVLRSKTPKRTGKTANSWYGSVEGELIIFFNTNLNDGFPIAAGIEFGHITKDGSFVPPHPYVDKSMKKVIKKVARMRRK